MIGKQLFHLRIIALLCMGSVFASAQLPDTLWTRIHSISPGGDIDDGKCVRQTNDGGYIIAGACVPNGLVSHIDVLLLRTDTLGHIQWVKTFGREFIEEGLAVEQTFDQGYVIGGRALSITGPNPYTDNQSDLWMLKTDINGDTLWTKTYGDSGHDYCTSIRQTSDSGYIMTGTKNSGRSYPPNCFIEYTQSALESAWLVKTDTDGDTVWTKTFHVGSYGNCVEQTSDGGYIIVGMIVSNNQPDIYLVKTDSSGHTLWTKIIGSSDSLEFGRAIRQLPDGYIITGHIGPMPVGVVDGLLIKTDLFGEVIWTKSYGGSLSDVGNSVEVASDGGFFVAGNTNTLFHIHNGDMWAFKTDSGGNLLWERIYDIALNDYAWSSTTTFDGGYVVTGMLGYSIGGDLWLAKIGIETGIIDNSQWPVRHLSIQNHPNPFNRATTISYEISRPDVVSLEIYDMLGRKIQTVVNDFQNAGIYSVYLDMRTFASGAYFCKLQVGDNVVETKMILLAQ